MERSVDRLKTHYLRLDKIYSRHITWDWTKPLQDTLLVTGQNLFKTHYLGLDKTFTGHITCDWTKSIQDKPVGDRFARLGDCRRHRCFRVMRRPYTSTYLIHLGLPLQTSLLLC